MKVVLEPKLDATTINHYELIIGRLCHNFDNDEVGCLKSLHQVLFSIFRTVQCESANNVIKLSQSEKHTG